MILTMLASMCFSAAALGAWQWRPDTRKLAVIAMCLCFGTVVLETVPLAQSKRTTRRQESVESALRFASVERSKT